MALIKCMECNNEISEFSDFCPHCGCPTSMSINTEQNKKINNTKYSIKLSKCETNKVKTIAKIRKIIGCDLATSKKIVDELSFIKVNCSIEEVNEIKKMIESEGASVQVLPYEQSHKYEVLNNQNTTNTPKCPTCGSINIQKIPGTKKTMSIIGLGILSNNIGKTFECLSCGYKW